VTTKERLHKLVDELSDQEAEAALVIVERRRDDPMLQALAAAPLDDESSYPGEDPSAAEALAAYQRGRAFLLMICGLNSISSDARLVPSIHAARAA
jgi:hypothetical protein